jgi:beta-lactamase superfamily II metal-dependent hydrolase
MADFYDITFHPAHGSRSGDAITIMYEVNGQRLVHVVDGGYTSTAPVVSDYLRREYGVTHIDHVVVTHPHEDHAQGLAPILEEFTVGTLWMLRPWAYAEHLIPYFARYESAERLASRLRANYPDLDALEKIAIRRRFSIEAPFQSSRIGAFTVLAPTWPRYAQMVTESDKTPQPAAGISDAFADAFTEFARRAVRMVRDAWGSERFSSEDTDSENEMSVIQFGSLNGHKIVLTGDAGRSGMNEAAGYAPTAGLFLPGVDRFQAPHHGGRRNLSTEILDHWIGPRLSGLVLPGQERFTAMISAAKEDPHHPRKAVIRAFKHRGALIGTTEEDGFSVWAGIPGRNRVPLPYIPYPDEQEE